MCFRVMELVVGGLVVAVERIIEKIYIGHPILVNGLTGIEKNKF